VRRALALGCLATIGVADYVTRRRRPRWIVLGVFDEPAHVATAVLILLNLPRKRTAGAGGGRKDWTAGAGGGQKGRTAGAGSGRTGWTGAYLVGSLLPDLDHIPLALRKVHPQPGDPRPVTHCLLTVAPAAALSPALAAGMLAHFTRDLGVGTGVPLLWPATPRSLRVPYSVYLAGCLLLAGRATLRNGL
jgi:hypothetical protein